MFRLPQQQAVISCFYVRRFPFNVREWLLNVLTHRHTHTTPTAVAPPTGDAHVFELSDWPRAPSAFPQRGHVSAACSLSALKQARQQPTNM